MFVVPYHMSLKDMRYWLRFGIPAHPSLNMRFIPLYVLNIVVREDSEPIPRYLHYLRVDQTSFPSIPNLIKVELLLFENIRFFFPLIIFCNNCVQYLKISLAAHLLLYVMHHNCLEVKAKIKIKMGKERTQQTWLFRRSHASRRMSFYLVQWELHTAQRAFYTNYCILLKQVNTSH